METAYAQALWKLLEKGIEPNKAVRALHEQLIASGRVQLLPRIGHAFSRIAARALQKNALRLTVAREKDARKAENHIKDLLKELDVKVSELSVCVDESLIGGWRLEGKEKLVDQSYKKHLMNIYQRVTDTV